jgi:hypothetical protein
MLRITIDLVPFGDEEMTKKIGEMVIANKTMTLDSANYEAWAADDKGFEAFAELTDFDRSKGPWELLRLISEAMLLEDHQPDQEPQSHSQRLKAKLLKNWGKYDKKSS